MKKKNKYYRDRPTLFEILNI